MRPNARCLTVADRGDSRFARGIREICGNRSVPMYVLTILVGFVLFNPLRTNFCACKKFTTGLTLDYVKFFVSLYYCGKIQYNYKLPKASEVSYKNRDKNNKDDD